MVDIMYHINAGILFLILFLIKCNLHELSHFVIAKMHKLNPKYPFPRFLIWPFNIVVDNNLLRSAAPHIQAETMLAGIRTDSITLLVTSCIWIFIRSVQFYGFVVGIFIIAQMINLVTNMFSKRGDVQRLIELLHR